MTPLNLESSPRSCRSHWPSAVFLAVMAAALAASLSGCMRAGANAGDARANATQRHTLVALEKTTADGRTVEVPIAEEYRTIRPADGAPAIPPSEMWPAQ